MRNREFNLSNLKNSLVQDTIAFINIFSIARHVCLPTVFAAFECGDHLNRVMCEALAP